MVRPFSYDIAFYSFVCEIEVPDSYSTLTERETEKKWR